MKISYDSDDGVTTKPEEMSDEESSSTASGSSSEYESSSDEEVVLKPVFVGGKKRNLALGKNEGSGDAVGAPKHESLKGSQDIESEKEKQRILEKADRNEKENKESNEADYEDDKDDLDVEKEYADWKAREKARYERDMKLLQEEEEAKEES